MQKLNCLFNDQTMELLILGFAFDPKDAYKAFNIDKISTLVSKYYSMDSMSKRK